jgi:hypothetical protein
VLLCASALPVAAQQVEEWMRAGPEALLDILQEAADESDLRYTAGWGVRLWRWKFGEVADGELPASVFVGDDIFVSCRFDAETRRLLRLRVTCLLNESLPQAYRSGVSGTYGSILGYAIAAGTGDDVGGAMRVHDALVEHLSTYDDDRGEARGTDGRRTREAAYAVERADYDFSYTVRDGSLTMRFGVVWKD